MSRLLSARVNLNRFWLRSLVDDGAFAPSRKSHFLHRYIPDYVARECRVKLILRRHDDDAAIRLGQRGRIGDDVGVGLHILSRAPDDGRFFIRVPANADDIKAER